MHAESTTPSDATNFNRTYPGAKNQVQRVREDVAAFAAGCPFADDLVLMASELAANAVLHSRSGRDGGTFTVRAGVRPLDFAWLEVEDQGGPWAQQEPGDENGRGLTIIEALAGEGNWTTGHGTTPGSRVVWTWLDWPHDHNQGQGQAS
jgi:serine/threonine-protein kinase RsbW